MEGGRKGSKRLRVQHNHTMHIQNLPYPRHIGIKHVKEWTAHETVYLEQWEIPAGTKIKLWQSENFGNVVIPQNTQDVRGFTIPRRIFQW